MLGSTKQVLRKNPFQFFLQRRSYARQCRPDPSRTEHSEILAALIRDGICLMEGYMDPSRAADIRNEVTEILYRVRDGEIVEGAKTLSHPEYGCYYLDEVERHSPSSLSYIDDPMILSVATAYGGGSVVPFGTRAELRSEPLKNERVDDPHADTWKYRFKAMLYLTDVTEETSPLQFLAGTHRDTGWRFERFRYDYLGHGFQGHPRIERSRLNQVLRIWDDPRYRRMVCTGPAGTLILFDSRGLHSATTLQKGTRVILNRTFVLAADLG